MVLQLVNPLQVAAEPYGARQWTIRPHIVVLVKYSTTSSRRSSGGSSSIELYGCRQWTIRPHYPIMCASYAHY